MIVLCENWLFLHKNVKVWWQKWRQHALLLLLRSDKVSKLKVSSSNDQTTHYENNKSTWECSVWDGSCVLRRVKGKVSISLSRRLVLEGNWRSEEHFSSGQKCRQKLCSVGVIVQTICPYLRPEWIRLLELVNEWI